MKKVQIVPRNICLGYETRGLSKKKSRSLTDYQEGRCADTYEKITMIKYTKPLSSLNPEVINNNPVISFRRFFVCLQGFVPTRHPCGLRPYNSDSKIADSSPARDIDVCES